jgi:type IV pilus assembly protein PilA
MEPATVGVAPAATTASALPDHLTAEPERPIYAAPAIDGDLLPRRAAPEPASAPPAPPRPQREGEFIPAQHVGPPRHERRMHIPIPILIGGVIVAAVAIGGWFFFLRSSKPATPATHHPKQHVITAQERAQDRAAESELRNALTAEKLVYTDSQRYVASTALLKGMEPSIQWGSQVHISLGANSNIVCMWMASASGTKFAVADVAAGPMAGTYYAPQACPSPLTASTALKLGRTFNRKP